MHFPQLSDVYTKTVEFKGSNWTWIRPTSMEELVRLKTEHPAAPVIMGNTTAGRYTEIGGKCWAHYKNMPI